MKLPFVLLHSSVRHYFSTLTVGCDAHIAPRKSDKNCFRCRIFVAALLREVARRSRDRGSFSLMRLYSLSQLRWQLPHWRSPLSLSPTASRCGSVTSQQNININQQQFSFLCPLSSWSYPHNQKVLFPIFSSNFKDMFILYVFRYYECLHRFPFDKWASIHRK